MSVMSDIATEMELSAHDHLFVAMPTSRPGIWNASIYWRDPAGGFLSVSDDEELHSLIEFDDYIEACGYYSPTLTATNVHGAILVPVQEL